MNGTGSSRMTPSQVCSMNWPRLHWRSTGLAKALAFHGMKSRAVASFWAGYDRLPGEVRKIADKQYRLWLENPSHPSIQFQEGRAVLVSPDHG